MNAFWQGLGRRARFSLVAGIAVILMAAAGMGYWALRAQDEVLFNNLSAQDAAAMTAELDRMKQPYRLGPDGTSILVDRDAVHRVRLKLMGKDLPLHGAVGFELFNNSDFGMTEFTQKVNYQRALQGEITRTILSLEEVASARVHLALPEERLFKNDQNRPKASITLGLHRGRTLGREQVAGIQRLVAAAVPGIAVHDVTLTNQQGVALTRAEGVEADGPGDGEAIGMKADVERHLVRKAKEVLDRRFGSGAASISVDAMLDMNRVRVTKEEVLGASAGGEPQITGVVVKERESTKDNPDGQRDSASATATLTNRDVEYQVGRRVEQVVSQQGSVVKLQVAVVVHAPLDADQVEQTRALVSAAVGAVPARGDVIVVQAVHEPAAEVVTPAPAGPSGEPASGRARSAHPGSQPVLEDPITWISALALLVSALVIAVVLRQRRRAAAVLVPMHPPRLTEADRAEALLKIQRWLAEPTSGPGRSA